MFRASSPQRPLFSAGGMLPEEKRERCRSSWAGPFRDKILPMLREMEEEFADLYHPENGRPNRPVELVLGVLILKEMFDLTDQETVDALEFDVRWWYAFDRDLSELHLCVKTLYNFRRGLMEQGRMKVAFRRVTDALIRLLEIDVTRQRLDSTHVYSNVALLTRLGLICETIRIFLRALKRLDSEAYESLGKGLRRRHKMDSSYGDAKQKDRPRRLAVVARDLWRLIDRFEGDDAVTSLEEWDLLTRVFEEQCEVVETVQEPKEDDDDRDAPAVPVVLKKPKEVDADSLQTPHDSDVTYSSHKGKGYSVQIMETCGESNPVEMITEVDVTRACDSDTAATQPMVKAATDAGQGPEEVVADCAFGGSKNAAALSSNGVKLTAPAKPAGKPGPEEEYDPPTDVCPTDPIEAVKWLRRREASPEFKKEYAIRAGVEATMSEMKRSHGLRNLTVRGEDLVRLASYFKAAACNIKRAIRHLLTPPEPKAEAAACGV